MLTRYYSSLFSNKESSIRTYVDKIEDNLFSLFENLPYGICIVSREDSKNKFVINFRNDSTISPEEYVLLSSVFQQYYNLENDMYEIYFVTATGKLETFQQYIDANLGGFKLLRAVLFLDFTNAVEFMYNFFSFHTLDSAIKFRTLPSSEKKDTWLSMKAAVKKDIDLLSNEYDRTQLEVTDHIKVTDSMHKILSDLEVGYKLHTSAKTLPQINKSGSLTHYKEKVKKISTLLGRMDTSKPKLIKFVNYVMQNPERTPADSARKKVFESILIKRDTLKARLVNTQNGYLRELNSLAVGEIHAEIAESPAEEFDAKIRDVRRKLAEVEEAKKVRSDHLATLRDKINSLNMQTLDLDSKLAADFKPVDMDKLAYDNIIALDTPASMSEKLVRFATSFFNNLSPESYLTVHQRREFLKRLNPYLKIKSISTYKVSSLEDFICIA